MFRRQNGAFSRVIMKFNAREQKVRAILRIPMCIYISHTVSKKNGTGGQHILDTDDPF